MFHVIEDVLNNHELAAVLAEADRLEFSDGGKTAGAIANKVKSNLQAHGFAATAAHKLVLRKLARHPGFVRAAFPERISELLLSRYEHGMAYGCHVDNPTIGTSHIRSDLAFTLFLSDPDSYEGGALEIRVGSGVDNIISYKLPVGSLVLYPAHYVHRVAEVAVGRRIALVGWVQSAIRDAGKREIVRELRRARHRLLQLDGDSEAFEGLNRAVGNLTRMWTGK